jgi:hypothetical protein
MTLKILMGVPYLPKEHAKISGVCFKPFHFIYGLCSIDKSSQHVGYDVKPLLQGVQIGYFVCWQRENTIDCK